MRPREVTHILSCHAPSSPTPTPGFRLINAALAIKNLLLIRAIPRPQLLLLANTARVAMTVPVARTARVAMAVLWTLIFLWVAPIHLEAAELEGQARMARSEAPVAHARVELVYQQGGHPRVITGTTDADGRFRFSDAPAGPATVRLLHPDFATVSAAVVLTDEGMTHVQIVLEPDQLPVAEVVYVEDRANTDAATATFSNLSRQDLEERGAIKDLPILMSELPSTTFYSENGNGVGYNYLTMRGIDQRRISVMIDGVPQNDPEDHNVYWINFFDLAGSLEDIQVQRGPGAGFYGPPAMGGSLNLVTRQLGTEAYQRLEVGVGSFGTQKYSAEINTGLLANNLVFYGRFSHLRSEGYRDWSWSRFWRGFLGLAWYGERSYVKLQAYGGPQNDALAYYGIPKDYNEDDGLRTTNWGAPDEVSGRTGDLEHFNQIHVDLIHDWVPSDRLAFHTTAFFISGVGYFDFDGSWGTPGYYQLCQDTGEEVLGDFPEYCVANSETGEVAPIPSDTLMRAYVNNKQIGILPRVTFTHASWGELNAGIEARAHRSLHWGRIQNGSGYPTDVVGDADKHHYQYRGAKDIFSPYDNERASFGRLHLEGNFQAVLQRYRLYDEQVLLGGAGGNTFTQRYFFPNVRLGASLTATERVTFFGTAGVTSRGPRLKELYDAESAAWGATPNLTGVTPEQAQNLEVGVRLEGARARLTTVAYLTDFKDELVPSGGLDAYGQPYYGNAERTRHMGLELEGGVRLLEGLDLTGNTTLSRNRFVSFTEYIGLVDDVSGDWQAVGVSRDGNPIAGAPDLTANLRLSYRRAGFLTALDARYVGIQYVDNSGDSTPIFSNGTLVEVSAAGALTVDPYTLLGAQVAYRMPTSSPLKGLTLSAEVSNLLNARVLLAGYEADNYFPASNRAFFVRMVYEH